MKLAFLMLMPLLLVQGCAGNQALEVGVRVTNGASGALNALDREVVPLYEEAAERTLNETLQANGSLDDYNSAMADWNRVEDGLSKAHISLLAAQEALRAWETGSQTAQGETGEAAYLAAISCTIAALRAVSDGLQRLGVDVAAPQLYGFLATAETFTGTCEER
jgi:hypothetical protein